MQGLCKKVSILGPIGAENSLQFNNLTNSKYLGKISCRPGTFFGLFVGNEAWIFLSRPKSAVKTSLLR